jgi:hypothetical protein
MRRVRRSGVALAMTVWAVGCSDTALDANNDQGDGGGSAATIVGRLEAEAPADAGAMTTAAELVEVAQVDPDGSLSRLAEASLDADGSFRVEGVPVERESLVVVARDASALSVGGVLVSGRTSTNGVIEVAPIDVSSTLEARVFERVRAHGSTVSYAEATLLVHAPPGTDPAIAVSDEVEAVATGVAVAIQTLTELFAVTGAELDADARTNLLGEATAAFARSRYGGTSPEVAEDVLLDAAVDALLAGGVSLEAIVQATAGAATVLDASLYGVSAFRGAVDTEPVRLNLRGRAGLAAAFESSVEGPVARDVMSILASVEDDVLSAASAAGIRTALDVGITAALGSTISTAVDLLVPNGRGQLPVRVRRAAEDAAAEARLSIRLANATTAQHAAAATASYRADVRAAVQSMVDTSGNGDVDVDTLTSLFIAAFGGAAIR